MNVESLLADTSKLFSSADIGTPRLDTELLLAYATSKDRAWILAHPEYELSTKERQVFSDFVQRRSKHEPIAYIIGSGEFYGRDFEVNEHTLVPRPETETMIEMALSFIESDTPPDKELLIIDVGTGSGAIGITMALEAQKLRPTIYKLRPVLIDVDKECLAVAKRNALKHKVDTELLQGNLLEPAQTLPPSKNTIIFANLPYVPESFPINKAATHEPKLALFGGADGLDLFRELYYQIANFSQFDSSNVIVFTESLPRQHQKLAQVAAEYGFALIAEQDFIQCFKTQH